MSDITKRELIAAHGTLSQFTRAVLNAIGEISVDEAYAAIEAYRKELESASE